MSAQQVFDRENAVEYYVIFAAGHGGVNPETSDEPQRYEALQRGIPAHNPFALVVIAVGYV